MTTQAIIRPDSRIARIAQDNLRTVGINHIHLPSVCNYIAAGGHAINSPHNLTVSDRESRAQPWNFDMNGYNGYGGKQNDAFIESGNAVIVWLTDRYPHLAGESKADWLQSNADEFGRYSGHSLWTHIWDTLDSLSREPGLEIIKALRAGT